MAFFISRTTNKDLGPHRPCQRGDTALAPDASMSLRRTAHWTSLSCCLLYSFRHKHSRHARRRQRFPLPCSLRAVTVQRSMLPVQEFVVTSKVVENDSLGGLHQLHRIPSGCQSILHCRARLQTYFRATVRALVPIVDDASTTIQVLS